MGPCHALFQYSRFRYGATIRLSADRQVTETATLFAGYGHATRLAGLYYAWQVNEHFELTPDLQWFIRPGADKD